MILDYSLKKSSTFSALTVCNIHFYTWKWSKLIFMWYPVWSILVCKISQFWAKATSWDSPSYFYYVLFPKGSQKKISAHVLIPVCRSVYHYFEINPCNFCCLLFSEDYLNPHVRINKMVSKHTVDYHPSAAQLISRIHHLIFLWIPKGFISPESLLNFFLNLYIPPWLRKSFKFTVLRLLQIHLQVKKLNLFIFTHAPKQNFPPSFYHYPPGRRELPISPEQCFWRYFFLRRKGAENYGVEKNTKINKGIGHKFW